MVILVLLGIMVVEVQEEEDIEQSLRIRFIQQIYWKEGFLVCSLVWGWEEGLEVVMNRLYCMGLIYFCILIVVWSLSGLLWKELVFSFRFSFSQLQGDFELVF